MSAQASYDKLKERFAMISGISNAAAILYKEMEITMPGGSSDDRVHQLVAISSTCHHLLSAPEVGQWLSEAQAGRASFSVEDQRNLDLMQNSWVHATAVTTALAGESARVDSEGQHKHSKNYKSGDWSLMKDWYEYAFDVARRIGEAKKDKLGVSSVYDALLDQFSPGLRDAVVTKEFALLEKELPALVNDAVAKQKNEQVIPLSGPFAFEAQEELCRRVTKAMGFDYDRGRFDLTRDHHPSCGGTQDDTRITGRFEGEDNFLPALYAAIHEAGHGMYEQNAPKSWRYQPAGGTLGMAVHESQSMIWELQAGMSPEFFEYLEKEVRDVFGRPNDPALSAENLQRLMTRVAPSFIRIEADELTYPTHIVLRWRLEKEIMESKLKVEDLPQAFNDGMQKLLGIVPPDNSKGCMQDLHWPTGSQGYFPAYTFGAMGAAQLFNAACKARPELKPEMSKGNFNPLREWLRDNVHSKGSLLTADEMFKAATGETLNARYYLDHLSRRYTGKAWAPGKP